MPTKKTSKSSETRTVAPPSWTMPGIEDASSRVTAALGNLPTATYGGDFTAPVDYSGAIANYGQAAQRAQQLAGFGQQQLTAAAPQYDFSTTLPSFDYKPGTYDVGNGTDLTGKIQASLAPVYQQLTQQLLPSLRSSAMQSGAYSGSRAQEILPAMALQDYGQTAGNIASTIGYQDYNDREQRRLSAYGVDQGNALQAAQTAAQTQLAGFSADSARQFGMQQDRQNYANSLPDLIDTILRASTGSGDIAAQAAGLEQQQQQAVINNNLARQQYAVQQPFQGLDIATQLLAALSGNYGTTTSSGTQTQTSGGLGSVVAGGAGLAGLVGGFPVAGGGTFGGQLLGNLFKKGA
jgi:hypothetical protein